MEPSAQYLTRTTTPFPIDWINSRIGELITEFRGGAPFKPSDFKTSGVMVLPKGGVNNTGWLSIKQSEIQFCAPKYADSHVGNQVDRSFVIVVLRDLVPSGPSIGLIVQIKSNERFVLAQGVYGFKVVDSVCPSFLIHLSNTQWYRRLANSIMVGSTQVHITNTAFKNAVVPVPKKAEQEAIANALSDADSLIESLEQLLTKKRKIKQGAMQELLTGKRRLPEFSGEWTSRSLGELADIRGGGTPSTLNSVYWDGDIDWCTPTDITALKGKKYLETTTKKISNLGLKASSAELIPAKSVLMTSRATIGECAINDMSISTNQGFKNFIPKRGVDMEFLYYLLTTQTKGFLELCSGSTFPEISKTSLNSYRVQVPKNSSEQVAISSFLTSVDREVEVLETKLTKARQIKQGMMQELLTGRIRLV
jgi:restriction endonuclease S subunit